MGVRIVIEVNHPMPMATIFEGEKQVFRSPLRIDLADDLANQPLPNQGYSYQDRKTWENRVKNKVLKALQQTLVGSRYSSARILLQGLPEGNSENQMP